MLWLFHPFPYGAGAGVTGENGFHLIAVGLSHFLPKTTAASFGYSGAIKENPGLPTPCKGAHAFGKAGAGSGKPC